MQVFSWVMLQNKILTAQNLRKKWWYLLEFCYICKQDGETVDHLFNNCAFYRQARLLLLRKFGFGNDTIQQFSVMSAQQFLLCTTVNRTTREIILILCFVLWRERCNRIFREEIKSANMLVEEVVDEWKVLHK